MVSKGYARRWLAEVLGGSGGFGRRFCGEIVSVRQAFRLLGRVRSVRRKLTEGVGSGNIPMVYVTRRDVAAKGLMASCDIFGERSMQYGTYASANS